MCSAPATVKGSGRLRPPSLPAGSAVWLPWVAALTLAAGLPPGVVSAAERVASAAPVTAPAHYLRERWLDDTRQRHVTVRIALPERTPAAGVVWPVMLLSSPQGYRWSGHTDHYVSLSEALARRGVVVVTVSHADADEPLGTHERFADVYPGLLTGRLNDPAVDRYEDMRFVIRQLEARATGAAAIGARALPLDLGRMAVAGHSSGTWTALHMAGMPVRNRQGEVHAQQHDPRIRALVLYSSPLGHKGPSRSDLAAVGPVAGLHVAGAQDTPSHRGNAWRHLNRAPQHWLVVEGGHNVGARGSDALVLEATGLFVDGFLKGQAEARSALGLEALSRHGEALKQWRSKPAQTWAPLDAKDFAAWARETLPGGGWLHAQGMRFERERQAQARAEAGAP